MNGTIHLKRLHRNPRSTSYADVFLSIENFVASTRFQSYLRRPTESGIQSRHESISSNPFAVKHQFCTSTNYFLFDILNIKLNGDMGIGNWVFTMND